MAYKGPNEAIGPGSSTDNALSRWDGTDGFVLQNSGAILNDSDALSGLTQLDVDNIRIDGNTISSTDSNGNVILAPDGTGVVSVTDAAILPSGDRAENLGSSTNNWDNVFADGITFDDGSNILSVYEQGTFTPSISFGGSSTGITYASRAGQFIRIGNFYFFQINMSLSNKGSATGTAVIEGIPTGPSIQNSQFFSPQLSSVTFSADYIVMRYRSTAPAGFRFVRVTSASLTAELTDTAFANNSDFRFSGSYIVS